MATADPANNPQLNGLLAQDREKQSVAVHSFDPDATPAQKAAAAGKGRSQLTNGNSKDDSPGGKGECALRFVLTSLAPVPRMVLVSNTRLCTARSRYSYRSSFSPL